MKAATTSLYGYLESHPEICPAVTKEPEFFTGNTEHGVEVERFEDLWCFDISRHRYAIEASTGYTKYPSVDGVPQKIAEYGLKPKFIYIVRNPFERIESHYNFMQHNERWKKPIDDEHLINTSDYYLQLEQYLKFFPREDFLILDFDDIKHDPKKVMKSVYDFLGITDLHYPDVFHKENTTHVASTFERKLRTLRLHKLLRKSPKGLQVLIKSMLMRVSRKEKQKLTEEQRNLIHERLAVNTYLLQEKWGIDVSKWGF